MNRTAESPMDFQYEHGTPADPNSPWRTAAMQNSLVALEQGRKRPLGFGGDAFNTPSKVPQSNGNGFNAPTAPFLFNTPQTIPHTRQTLAQPPAPEADMDDTPGADGGDETDMTPVEREEKLRKGKKGKVADGALRKVKKRREGGREKRFWKGEEKENDSESGDDATMLYTPQAQLAGPRWSLDPDHITTWLQFFFNLLLVAIPIYLFYALYTTIIHDVDLKIEEYSSEILAEMALCTKEYLDNHCSMAQRPPALEGACNAWERCMNRDPTVVGRARVGAETFAEIVNSFVEPISYKTMIFGLLVILGSAFLSNVAFGFFRQKAQQHHQTQHHTVYTQPMMIAPQYRGHERSRSVKRLNIAYPANGTQKLIDIDDERRLRVFMEKRMGAEVPGDSVGDEFKGYVFKITGGNDKQGFPMKQGVLHPSRVRLLLSKGHSCYRPRREGERKRKSVRGCIVAMDLSVLSLVVVKQGEADIPGLTDTTVPKRLGPKRASKIRKFFNLSKEDDVRKFVIRREVQPKNAEKKAYTKAPKIQRLVTPRTLQHKRHRLALKRRRAEAQKEAASAYADLLTKRVTEAKDRKAATKARRASSMRK
ncbi:hypothetical protein SAICODRAFT_16794 [Saitoella complicata NRRL Y-17804]|uniref:uncharacterized protein n=1 Tax=Saitoella complicata (strain BCRC 22490 / CBS 7301 / JCM 7358 / NBRC 10748 / NRRL Y-17804) TaxID=698492 RepID=UPI0008680DF7|nr:uncharacterized protein SAICODRAFT_16794 [Saitoella complicata NRRL Y-17804]ODQ55750.1 hypothetical protein SAICODRAFT_16794 [Saitoella complicata NRRL Y-17804]